MNPTKFSIRLNLAELRRLRAACKHAGISMSAVIRYAVTHGLLENLGGAECQKYDEQCAREYAARDRHRSQIKVWDPDGKPETWDPSATGR